MLKEHWGVVILLNSSVEDSGDASLKRRVMGHQVIVAITKGRLDFGPWEQIFHGAFGGGRRKQVLVKTIGGSSTTDGSTNQISYRARWH